MRMADMTSEEVTVVPDFEDLAERMFLKEYGCGLDDLD